MSRHNGYVWHECVCTYRLYKHKDASTYLVCLCVCGMSLLSHGCCSTLSQIHWLILSSRSCNRLLFRESSKEAVNDPECHWAPCGFGLRVVSHFFMQYKIMTHYWLVICNSNCEYVQYNDYISMSCFPQSDGSTQYWGCGRNREGTPPPGTRGSQKGTQHHRISRISSGQLWTHWRVPVSLIDKGVLLLFFSLSLCLPNFFYYMEPQLPFNYYLSSQECIEWQS